MHVPFYDFKLAPDELRTDWKKAAGRVIDSGRFLQSDWNSIFQEDFRLKLNRKFALGVSNGLDGLVLSLRALGLTPGKRIAVPAHTFIAVWNAVLAIGAQPVPIGVDQYGQIDLKEVIKSNSSAPIDAVIAVHMHGFPVSLSSFKNWCEQNNVLLIEDCSQAHFAFSSDGPVGTLGHIAIFSHYPSKNLPALGDAGTVVCDDEELFNNLKSLANYGSDLKNKYFHYQLGYNCRMDAIQAAILSLNLQYIDEWNSKRVELAFKYDERLSSLPLKILHRSNEGSVFHHYCILVENRSQLVDFLSRRGIETNIHYPVPPYKEVINWGDFNWQGEFSCQTTDMLADTSLSLPISQWHTPKMIDYVSESLKIFFNRG